MNLYMDSSVLLRLVLEQADALAEPRHLELAFTSVVSRLECWRTLDRHRLRETWPDMTIADRGQRLQQILDQLALLELDEPILAWAARPLPVPLGSLDAVHLATALLWRERTGKALAMATHDRQLALASRALGLAVVGCEP